MARTDKQRAGTLRVTHGHGVHPARGLEPSFWYACHTRARHEKRVDERLRRLDFETCLPVVARRRQWHDRTRVVEFPVFPGYVFVRSPLERIGEVGRADGAASVVRFNGRPAPIADREIANVRRFTRALARSEETELLAAPAVQRGQPVRVESGPLAGIEGLVLEKRGKGRALIQIGIGAIGLGVTAEIDAADLRRLGRAVES